MNLQWNNKGDHSRYDFPGGLIDDVYYIMMLDLLMPILTYYIDIWYYLRYVRPRNKIKAGKANSMTQ